MEATSAAKRRSPIDVCCSNTGDADDDGDGVADASDGSPLDQGRCADADADGCDDCAVTGAPGPHTAFVVQLGGMVADEVAPPGAPRVSPETRELLAALLTGVGDEPLDVSVRAQVADHRPCVDPG